MLVAGAARLHAGLGEARGVAAGAAGTMPPAHLRLEIMIRVRHHGATALGAHRKIGQGNGETRLSPDSLLASFAAGTLQKLEQSRPLDHGNAVIGSVDFDFGCDALAGDQQAARSINRRRRCV